VVLAQLQAFLAHQQLMLVAVAVVAVLRLVVLLVVQVVAELVEIKTQQELLAQQI
jgi:hypothetical protein